MAVKDKIQKGFRCSSIVGVAVLAAAANALVASCGLVARSTPAPRMLFKPIMALSGAMMIYLFFAGHATSTVARKPARTRYVAALSVGFLFLLLFVYAPSLDINFIHHDWTHRHISEQLSKGGISRMVELFSRPQGDGMYRPLGFVSLWFDYTLCSSAACGLYHAHNIALHVLVCLVIVMAVSAATGIWRDDSDGASGSGLYSSVGFERGLVAAACFALGSNHFEAIIWPAARFDLLAALFNCLAVLCLLRHLTLARQWSHWATGCLVSTVFAVLTKESGYSVPLIVFAILWVLWRTGRRDAVKASAPLACAVTGASILLVLVRYAVYSSFGGYRNPGGESQHAGITVKQLYLWIVNTLATAWFGLNNTQDLAWWCAAIASAYALWTVSLVLNYRGTAITRRRVVCLAAFALIAALPTIHVIGWIRPTLQHDRLLYWPSVWISILFAICMEGCASARRRVLTISFLLIQAGALGINVLTYRQAFLRADQVADVARDQLDPLVRTACLVGVPDDFEGVFYFREQISFSLREKTGITPEFQDSTDSCSGKPTWIWNFDKRQVTRR